MDTSRSPFAVTEFATAAVAAAGAEIADLVGAATGHRPSVEVDPRLATLWFEGTVHPIGWTPPPTWDPIAGDYETSDGWIRIHTNAPHHRAAALRALGLDSLPTPDRGDLATATATRPAADLEAAIVAAGGAAAAMRSQTEWSEHPQGIAVGTEPIVAVEARPAAATTDWRPSPGRPLAGVRVLDLTRVLAGPAATRFLAAYGADVLRIDPLDWDEANVAPEVTVGKRCARLDLRTADGRRSLEHLLTGADVLVHGYRSDALERLGLGTDRRFELRPDLVDVALDAYGWTGPWSRRRGFDSLVQMSSGIALATMEHTGADRPGSLPGPVLDYGTGFLLAAAAVAGLRRRMTDGAGSTSRLSLARSAALLVSSGPPEHAISIGPATDTDLDPAVEASIWGPLRRLRPPLVVDGAPHRWDLPAQGLGWAEPTWQD